MKQIILKPVFLIITLLLPSVMFAADRDLVNRYDSIINKANEREVLQLFSALMRLNTKNSIKKLIEAGCNKKLPEKLRIRAIKTVFACDRPLVIAQLKKIHLKKIKLDSIRRLISSNLERLIERENKELISSLKSQNNNNGIKKLAGIVTNKRQSMEFKRVAVMAIADCNFDKEAVTKQLINLCLKIKDQKLLSFVRSVLAEKGSSQFLLTKAITHANTHVRVAAFRHLQNKLRADSTYVLSAEMKSLLLNEEDVSVLAETLTALAVLLQRDNPDKSLQKHLIDLSQHDNPAVVSLALGALADSGSEEASVIALLKNNYSKLAWKARVSVLDFMAGQEVNKENLNFYLDCLAIEKGRLRTDIAQILSRLLECENIGVSYGIWKTAVDEYLNGDLKDYIENTVVAQTAGYYGVPITSKRIVFILDKTGSMNKNNQMPTAKKELCAALRSLDKKIRKKHGDKYLSLPMAERTFFTIQSFSK